MPHAVFNLGLVSDSGTVAGSSRQFIPGIEPGKGIKSLTEKRRMKPALLITDAYLVVNGAPGTVGQGAGETMSYFLKLSQEQNLFPGLLLPIGIVTYFGDNTNNNFMQIQQLFKAQGTVWASLWMGVRAVETGTAVINADIHLDYEMVIVPWQEWFLRWEFLDGVVDNSEEY